MEQDQIRSAAALIQEAWQTFYMLPPDSVQMRLLVAYVRQIGPVRQPVRKPAGTNATLADIDAAIGSYCAIGKT